MSDITLNVAEKEITMEDLDESVRSDYQQLRRELVEVQALQRELSSRLRSQLRLVHGKFAKLRQRLAAASELNMSRPPPYSATPQR